MCQVWLLWLWCVHNMISLKGLARIISCFYVAKCGIAFTLPYCFSWFFFLPLFFLFEDYVRIQFYSLVFEVHTLVWWVQRVQYLFGRPTQHTPCDCVMMASDLNAGLMRDMRWLETKHTKSSKSVNWDGRDALRMLRSQAELCSSSTTQKAWPTLGYSRLQSDSHSSHRNRKQEWEN